MNLSELSIFLKSRRSHFLKEFNGQIAPELLIDKLIENAQWAPNHKLTLPWKFIVFKNENLFELGNIVIDSLQEKLSEEKISKIKSWPNKISHMIAICMTPSQNTPEWEEIAAIGAAIQNMYLTLNSIDNFGGYWTTGNATNHETMRAFLSLPENTVHLGFFVIGGIDHKRTEAHRTIHTTEYFNNQ